MAQDSKKESILQDIKNVKVSTRSLPEQAAGQIRNLIIEQRLEPGDKLPNEFELMDRLQVGRGTIREAIKILVASNVLEIRRGRGTFVAKHPGQVKDPLGLAFVADEAKLIRDLLEIRLQIEPWAAALAAQNASEEDLEILRQSCKAVDDKLFSGQDHLQADEDLHLCIARCSKNMVLPKLLPIISYAIYKVGPVTIARIEPKERVRGTSESHHRIVDAICAHDPGAAQEAMAAHLRLNFPEHPLLHR